MPIGFWPAVGPREEAKQRKKAAPLAEAMLARLQFYVLSPMATLFKNILVDSHGIADWIDGRGIRTRYRNRGIHGPEQSLWVSSTLSTPKP